MDMRGSGIDNFPVFLMCGQLLFNFFNEATSSSMSSVLSAAPLLKKVYIPKYIFPLEKCCFAMVNCVFSFVALLLVMIFTGAPFHLTLIEAVYPLVTLFFFSLGVGLLLAAATVFFRDIMHIWSVFITALLYFSAIFYDPTPVSYTHLRLFQWSHGQRMPALRRATVSTRRTAMVVSLSLIHI